MSSVNISRHPEFSFLTSVSTYFQYLLKKRKSLKRFLSHFGAKIKELSIDKSRSKLPSPKTTSFKTVQLFFSDLHKWNHLKLFVKNDKSRERILFQTFSISTLPSLEVSWFNILRRSFQTFLWWLSKKTPNEKC